jgi:mannose-1-phosphate guanylyltransferase
MKALILAAGRGTRVQPLTHAVPKPMIPIVHTPVMEMLVDQLRVHGFTQIVVNTSFLAPQIESYFRDGHRFGVQMAYSFEGYEENGVLIDAPLGSAGAIRKIQSHSGFFDETFLVVCGDAIIDLDLTKLLRFHRKSGAIATMALKNVPESAVSSYGVVVHDAQGRITEFQEKPDPKEAKSTTVNTGIYLFEPAILDWIPESGSYDIGGQLFPALARAGAPLFGVALDFRWFDIGRIEDYYHVVMQAMLGKAPPYAAQGLPVQPDVWAGPNVRANYKRILIEGPVYIGGSASIGDGCCLKGPVVIGAGAVIEPGAHLEETIVLDHTRVIGFGNFRRKIVGPGYCVDADGTVLDGRHTDTNWLFRDARNLDSKLDSDQRMVLEHASSVS